MKLHKQHLVKFGLTAISALILTACGSSGGGGGSSASSSENTMPTNQVQQPDQPKTEVKPEQPAQPNVEVKPEQPVQPKAEVKPDNPTSSNVEVKPEQPVQPKTEEKPEHPKLDNSTGAFSSVKDKLTSDDLDIHIYPLSQFNTNKISIDRVEIEVDNQDYLNNLWASFSVPKEKSDVNICCEKYTDMRFGIITSLDETKADYLFYNGNPTQSMPMAGKASYQGYSVFHEGSQQDENKLIVGTSSFDVDFSEKKLSGVLTAQDIKPVNISANIQHNSFNGTATSESFDPKTNVKVEGKFFGENAKELGGIAESFDDDFGAAFGAEKTSK